MPFEASQMTRDQKGRDEFRLAARVCTGVTSASSRAHEGRIEALACHALSVLQAVPSDSPTQRGQAATDAVGLARPSQEDKRPTRQLLRACQVPCFI
jgi:hypothetical protein